jgi:hypothetical protein
VPPRKSYEKGNASTLGIPNWAVKESSPHMETRSGPHRMWRPQTPYCQSPSKVHRTLSPPATTTPGRPPVLDSVGSKLTQDAEQELPQLAAKLQSQEQPSIPPIVSPHPFFKFRPPLIPGFRVSEQPYKIPLGPSHCRRAATARPRSPGVAGAAPSLPSHGAACPRPHLGLHTHHPLVGLPARRPHVGCPPVALT